MSSIAATSTSTSTSSTDAYSGLTSADFMKIMLTELTQQNPLEPADTKDLIANLRELQGLLTEQVAKKRSDLSWASELVGQTVTVSQSLVTNDEYNGLVDSGLTPDIGASSASGTVDSYKVVDDEVWISVGGYDYPIDNVTATTPASGASNLATLAELGSSLNGRTIDYLDSSGSIVSGTVTGVNIGDDGEYTLTVAGEEIRFSAMQSVH